MEENLQSYTRATQQTGPLHHSFAATSKQHGSPVLPVSVPPGKALMRAAMRDCPCSIRSRHTSIIVQYRNVGCDGDSAQHNLATQRWWCMHARFVTTTL